LGQIEKERKELV
jgi:growth arrest-specific protein 8